jgi:hypothetical protein
VSNLWQAAWFEAARSRSRLLWRGVEAQHLIATLRLTETAAEHRLLEELLERSKPPLPPHAHARHYLLTTPFRYRSPIASRFRRAQDPGAWYGAEELRTACAEAGYWRWRFLCDSDGLARQALHTTHSFFRAQVRGRCLDLTRVPWSAGQHSWRDPRDYGACQALAAAARVQRVAWIRYQSARVDTGVCGAVFEAATLTLCRTSPMQTWVCRSIRAGVRLQRSGAAGESFEFDAASWV